MQSGGTSSIDDLNGGVINNGNLPTVTDTDVTTSSNWTFAGLYYANKNIYSTDLYFCPSWFGSFRLLGCQGIFKYTFGDLGGEWCDYYWKSFAGAQGGALTIDNPCLDDEGYPLPNKGLFYCEFSPLANGVTRETNTFSLLDVGTGTFISTTPILQIGNVGTGTVNVQRLSVDPICAPYCTQTVTTTNNPNAYGTIAGSTPLLAKWMNNGNYTWGAYSPNTIVYNEADGQYYSCTSTHHAGDDYITTTQNSTLYIVHEDNKPLQSQSWQSYWTPATMPAAWTNNTPYTVGTLVSNLYINGAWYHNCVYCCTANHTSSSATQPEAGSNWQSYWVSLQWQYNTNYTATTSTVACDSAYYQCIQSHNSGGTTAPNTTRPRPWALLPANAWAWVNYTGSGATNLTSTHMELATPLPPTAGSWNANEPVIYNPNPIGLDTPTEYRNPPGVAPDAWVGDNTLGNPVAP